MRYTKILFKVIAGVAFVGATAAVSFAGMNPASPGLPIVAAYGTTVANNQMSSMCVACHSGAVYGAGMASHFVFTDSAKPTHSGGGWTNLDYNKATTAGTALREGGQYFHLTAWTTAGIWSKYGNFANKVSETAAPANTPGFESTTKVAASALYTDEIICESCHNIVKNVAGGNNLVEKPGDATTPTGALAFTDSKVATLCVGCHGWLYDSNVVNAENNGPNGNFDNVWNMVGETGTTVKNSNAAEFKNDGVKHNVNHHVMSGDNRSATQATAMLNWSPTTQFDSTQAHRMSTAERLGNTYGLKASASWGAGFRPATTATNFSCLSCHTVAHGGALSTGASILRGTANGAAVSSLERISDGARSWKDQDANVGAGVGTWCQNCHKN